MSISKSDGIPVEEVSPLSLQIRMECPTSFGSGNSRDNYAKY
jgi:hypothetical protein